jgi:two-component system, LytTR family, sensor kinase
MIDTSISTKDLLFTLLLKVGVAASFAALLARWNTFRRVLFTEERDPDQKLKLMLFMTPPLIVGVALRLVGFPYRFADLSLEGAFLMGLLGGRVVGPIGGAIITIPAMMGHEWLGMPAAATAGLLGGLMRQAIPNKEDLWNFGPFTFLNIPRDLLRLVRQAKMSWELLPLLACVGLELGRVALVLATNPKWLFAIDPHWNWWLMLTVLATVMSVAAPLKIWNNTRIEMNLERHQQLLLKARMDALSSQINPHFLFNTLNTVSSLIRFDPDMARGVVLKLSNILRRLLRKHETFVPLKEELDFIDDYLDIEVARFGSVCPQHAFAADRRELLEARPGVETRRRPHPTAHHQPRRAAAHRDRRQRRGNFGREDAARLCGGNRSEQCARTPAGFVRGRLPPGDRKPPRRRHVDPHRHS